MAKNENIIELNGRRFDAVTGQMLAGSAPKAAPTGRFVDGFIRPSAVPAAQPVPRTNAVAPVRPLTHQANRKPTMDIKRPTGRAVAHHAPKKSLTLMRSAVAKPEPSVRRKSKATSHNHAVAQQPKFEIVKKMSHPRVDPKRAKRSALIAQSEYIRRFATPAAGRPAPVASTSTHIAAVRPSVTTVKPVYASTPARHAVVPPAASSLDVFERALQRANSHMELPASHTKQRTKRRKSVFGKRAFTASAVCLVLLIIGAFVALQDQANITAKYASTKAGFSANLPAYKPAGFSVGRFSYQPGQVGVTYTNNASGQTFNLVQKQSQLDSTSLRDSYVASQSTTYKTIESAGRTIYTYGQNNATWVNGGVWYQVQSAGSLTTEELVNLATSL